MHLQSQLQIDGVLPHCDKCLWSVLMVCEALTLNEDNGVCTGRWTVRQTWYHHHPTMDEWLGKHGGSTGTTNAPSLVGNIKKIMHRDFQHPILG